MARGLDFGNAWMLELENNWSILYFRISLFLLSLLFLPLNASNKPQKIFGYLFLSQITSCCSQISSVFGLSLAMRYASVWMLFWSHQNIVDQPKFAWELLKTGCLMSFLMFLASSQTGNAMETTLMTVQLSAAPRTHHLGSKEKSQINWKQTVWNSAKIQAWV